MTAMQVSNAILTFVVQNVPQADVLVIPLIEPKIGSTHIGKSLLDKAGNKREKQSLKSLFNKVAARLTFNPGDVLQVDAPAFLNCSKLFFIKCLPWDGVSGQSVQVIQAGVP